MKAYQRKIREGEEGQLPNMLFLQKPSNINLRDSAIREINFKTAEGMILKYEWIGTMPLPKSCRYIYGIFLDGIMGGAVVYVEPSTRQFYTTYPRQVVQLNRGACEWWTPKNTASKLIAGTLKPLRAYGIKLILAYCTPEAGEYGTIYQALGWWYVGDTSKSKSYYLDGHWISERTLADKTKWAKTKDVRWQEKFTDLPMRELLPKYKYIKLLGTKQENELIITQYGYSPLSYPKRPSDEVESDIEL